MPHPAPFLDTGLTVGIATYNGYTFPPAISARGTIEPVYESSNRVPKWWKHVMTIEFVVVPQMKPTEDLETGTADVDVNFEYLKRLLSIPGATLELTDKGLGHTSRETKEGNTFVISSTNDLNFGPRPQLTTWEPIGSSRAIRVQWSVEFAISVCCFSDYTGDGYCDNPPDGIWSDTVPKFTEFNYSVSHSVTEDGWMERTLVGTVEVAGILGDFLVGGGVPVGSSIPMPDSSLVIPQALVQNQITNLFPRLPGFHRSFQWDVSRDARSMDYRITDTEIPSDNPYLLGILKGKMTHRMRSDLPFAVWDCSINGSLEIQPNVARWLAFTAFLTIVKSRLANLAVGVSTQLKEFANAGGLEAKPEIPTWIPKAIMLEEELYGRTFNFDLNYTVYCSWHQIMAASKMFQPLDVGNWTLWLATQSPALYSGRGTSDLSVTGALAATVRCTDVAPTNINIPKGESSQYYLASLFTFQCPPPDKSWLDYKVWFEVESSSNVVTHQKSFLENADSYKDIGAAEATVLRAVTGIDTYGHATRQAQVFYDNQGQNNVVQAVGASRWRVTMHGYGVRACYDIPIPDLLAYGNGSPPVLVHQKIRQKYRLTSSGPVPIFAAQWSRTYELPDPPTGNVTTQIQTNAEPSEYLKNARIAPVMGLDPS